jgi:RND family efflux transporter MFP subunit
MFDRFVAGSCLAALLIAFAGCGHDEPAADLPAGEPKLPVIKAAVFRVEPSPWPTVVKSQGSLVADEVTVVGAKVAGRVAEVFVDLGDLAEADAPLARIDHEEYQLQVVLAEAQLGQARAALGLKPADPVESLNPLNSPPVREAKAVLDEAKTRVDRVRQLRQKNAVTQDEFDQAIAAEGVADARYASAINSVREKMAQISVRAAELSLAQEHLTNTTVKAPFKGLIHERHVNRGTFLQAGEPVVTLVRTSVLRFRGQVPERHAHRLAIGQQVTLAIEGVREPHVAKITRISPVVEEASRALAFEAAVDNSAGRLRTGLFAEADVIVDPGAQSLAVPPAAVTEFAGVEKVWKVVDGVAGEQVVRTARRESGAIEIVEGLAPGDIVLTNAAEGKIARVEVTSTSASPMHTAATGALADDDDADNAEDPAETPTSRAAE